jgi:two-component system cell cycle response regulator DivK
MTQQGVDARFPMTSSAPRDLTPAKPKNVSEAAPKRALPLVLVVDDFEDNRAMYAVYLTYSGYDVVEAGDGAEAVDVASKRLPDMIVMDLSLPVMDGWEATRRLKADPRTRHIPIIALTGHALEGHSRDAREAGCNAFLAKPCLPESLVEKVEELMKAAKASNEPG